MSQPIVFISHSKIKEGKLEGSQKIFFLPEKPPEE